MATITIPSYQAGGTLSQLAQRYGTTVAELMKLNPKITDPNKIREGDTLNVPDTGTTLSLTGTLGAGKTLPETQPLGRAGQLSQQISQYEEAYQPDMLNNFRQVLQQSSRLAYDQRRQGQEMGFDPSDVSGQTFASIVNWAEQQRGAAVSDIYKTGVYGQVEAQKSIGETLEDLRGERESLLKSRESFVNTLAMQGILGTLEGSEIDAIRNGDDITPEIYQKINEASQVAEATPTPPTSYKEWQLAGQPGTYEDWLSKGKKAEDTTQADYAEIETRITQLPMENGYIKYMEDYVDLRDIWIRGGYKASDFDAQFSRYLYRGEGADESLFTQYGLEDLLTY